MCGKIRQKNTIINENIREIERVGVELIVENMVQTRLRWFGRHVERKPLDSVVNRVDQINGVKSLEVENLLRRI